MKTTTNYNLTLANNTYTCTNLRYLKELKFIQIICAAVGNQKIDRMQAFELYHSIVTDSDLEIKASDEGGILSSLFRDGLLRKFTKTGNIDTGKKTKREKSVIQFILDFSDDVKNYDWCIARINTNQTKNALAAKNNKLKRKLMISEQNSTIEYPLTTEPISIETQKEFKFPDEVVVLAKNIFIERLRSMPMREFATLFGF